MSTIKNIGTAHTPASTYLWEIQTKWKLWKHVFLILMLLFCIQNEFYAQTILSGEVYDGNGGPLTLSGSPYIVPTGITIPTSQTLTIQPGVEVQMGGGASWVIDGTLIAEGTATSRIRFTRDTTGQSWNYLFFRGGSRGSMKYCDIEYGGRYGYPDGYPSLQLENSSDIVIDQCAIRYSGGDGLMGSIQSGTIAITNSTISDNGGYGINLYAPGGATISGNTLVNNRESAYRLSANVYPTSSTLSGNGFDGIEVGGTATLSGTYEVNLLVPTVFGVASGTTITLVPGVEVRMGEGAWWVIDGTLIAEGTATSRIRFTRDTTGQSWNYLFFRGGSRGSMKYCDIEYGGRYGYPDGYPSLQLENSSDIVIDQCAIRYSGGDGLMGSIQSGTIAITNSTISDNGGYGINLYAPGGATISGNTLVNNRESAYRLSANVYPTSSTLSGNGFDGIEVGGTATLSGTYEVNLLVPTVFGVASGTTITLVPGVEVRMGGGASWEIYGTLIAEGTATSRIRFTRDTTGQYWDRLSFRGGSRGSMKYCDIEYGGVIQLYIVDPTSFIIDNCEISNSKGTGLVGVIFGGTQSFTVTRTLFHSNGMDGCELELYDSASVILQCNTFASNGLDGLRVRSGKPAVVNLNRFSGNAGCGFTYNGSKAVNVQNNWWGDSSGPGGIGPGTGDKICIIS